MQSFLGSELSKGSGSLILTLLGRLDLIIDGISHHSHISRLGVSGRQYSTWGSTWASRRVGGWIGVGRKLRWIG